MVSALTLAGRVERGLAVLVEDRAAELGVVLHPVLRHRRALLAVGDEAVLVLGRVGQLVGGGDEVLHGRRRLEAGGVIEVGAIGEHVGVAGEGEGDLLALPVAECRHEDGIDVVNLDLGGIALDPVGQVDGVAGIGELADPDDVVGEEVIALGVADEVRGDLGEEVGIAEDVDLDRDAGLVLELRHEVGDHRRELVVLRGEVEGYAVIGLVRRLRRRESDGR